MSETSMDRKRARAVSRAAQGLAGVVLFTGIGAAMVLPRAEPAASSDDPLAGLDTDVDQRVATELARQLESDGSEMFDPDWEGVAMRLHLATDIPFEDDGGDVEPSAPGPTDATVDAGPTGDTTADTPSGSAATTVRYLGRVTVGNRGVALVSVDGSQAFIPEGGTMTVGSTPDTRVSVRILEVRDDEVELVEGDVERTIARAGRSASSVSAGPEADGSSVASSPSRDTSAPNRRSRNFRDRAGARTASTPLNRDDYRREDGTIDYAALRAAARERQEELEADRLRQARERSGDD